MKDTALAIVKDLAKAATRATHFSGKNYWMLHTGDAHELSLRARQLLKRQVKKRRGGK